ncbi:GGDEF domain-containing protein [Succinimonas sp.]|uniref:GGDEF domain-containing protein n=1 Tax=Succinimonas sp. TaxID=1936151 RepID=UPI003864950E
MNYTIGKVVLNYKASHDELTGAYNRTGYDLLLSSMDLKTTFMLLIDVDNFKGINDTYGHETGDRVLKKIVAVLNKNFRSDDYVCRLGGDEFAVFMVHAEEHLRDLVASKVGQINRQLADTSDSLPGTSISVGIIHGTQVNNREDLYKCADESLYAIKRDGKNGYAFYKAEA